MHRPSSRPSPPAISPPPAAPITAPSSAARWNWNNYIPLTARDSAAHPTSAAIIQGFAGEGGIGKSELAKRYAEQHGVDWDGDSWLDCSKTGHRASLTLLAKELGFTLAPKSAVAHNSTGELSRRARG